MGGGVRVYPFCFFWPAGSRKFVTLCFTLTPTPQSKAAGVAVLMAIYWMTEALPLPITSLLPLFLFPLLSLATSNATAALYFNDTIALFIATNIVGLAMEKYQLRC